MRFGENDDVRQFESSASFFITSRPHSHGAVSSPQNELHLRELIQVGFRLVRLPTQASSRCAQGH